MVANLYFSCSSREKLEKVRTEQTYFLMDTTIIASIQNISFKMKNPVKYEKNPVVKAQLPWEGVATYNATVLYDSIKQQYTMWYQTSAPDLKGPERTTICLATSKDGLRWKKPSLGHIKWRYSRVNNIIRKSFGHGNMYQPQVYIDLDEPEPHRRYKMLVWDWPKVDDKPKGGACVFFSDDGLHWKAYSANPVFSEPNDVLGLTVRPTAPKFLLFQQCWQRGWKIRVARDNLSGIRRLMCIRESDDFVHWTDQKTILVPDKQDPRDLQFYTMAGMFRHGLYIGFPSAYHTFAQTMDVQLVVSYDGHSWQRMGKREPFIPLGPMGSYDAGMIAVSREPVVVGDEIFIYYSGWDGTHDSKRRKGSMNLARLPLDRFVALAAGNSTSIIETKPFVMTGDSLFINADARDGEIQVELLTPEGSPVSGFERSQSSPIRENGFTIPLRWTSGLSTANLFEKKIKIKFYLKQAEIFTITIR